MDTQYHRTKQGIWEKCEATKQACPIKGANSHKSLTVNISMPNVKNKKEVNRLENFVLNNPEDFIVSPWYADSLDEAIVEVAKHPKTATLYDIINTNELESLSGSDTYFNTYVANLVKHRIPVEDIVASERNLLNPPSTARLMSEGWKAGYSNAIASYIAEKGFPVRLGSTSYGWEDYDLDRTNLRVVAVFAYREDYWSNFEGTFTENSDHHGVTGDAMFSDGTQRQVRWEGSLSDIMKNVL